MGLTFQEGKVLVRLAREVIERYVRGKEPEVKLPDWCKEKRGVFVTLETFPERELRGCIGYVEPIKKLGEALVECAIAACHDPRFPPLSISELDTITVEVSVLSPLEHISGTLEEKLEAIKEHKHGVVLSLSGRKAVFLPQVWEILKTKEEFLSNLALKAGLSPESWKDENCELYRFEVQAWREKTPRGEVEEVRIGEGSRDS